LLVRTLDACMRHVIYLTCMSMWVLLINNGLRSGSYVLVRLTVRDRLQLWAGYSGYVHWSLISLYQSEVMSLLGIRSNRLILGVLRMIRSYIWHSCWLLLRIIGYHLSCLRSSRMNEMFLWNLSND
jgi:hypothetical protein